MRKILYASDIHGNKIIYQKIIAKASAENIKKIIIGGDICPHMRSDNLAESVDFQREFLKTFLIPLILESNIEWYILMGNDDFRANMDLLEEENSKGTIKLLHNRMHKSFDKKIIGYSFVN